MKYADKLKRRNYTSDHPMIDIKPSDIDYYTLGPKELERLTSEYRDALYHIESIHISDAVQSGYYGEELYELIDSFQSNHSKDFERRNSVEELARAIESCSRSKDVFDLASHLDKQYKLLLERSTSLQKNYAEILKKKMAIKALKRDIDSNENLRNAWNEFRLMYKLVTGKDLNALDDI